MGKLHQKIINRRIKTHSELLKKLPENIMSAKGTINRLAVAISLDPADKKLRKYRIRMVKILDFFEMQQLKSQALIKKLQEQRHE